MENHHVLWVNQRTKWAMFNRYVTNYQRVAILVSNIPSYDVNPAHFPRAFRVWQLSVGTSPAAPGSGVGEMQPKKQAGNLSNPIIMRVYIYNIYVCVSISIYLKIQCIYIFLNICYMHHITLPHTFMEKLMHWCSAQLLDMDHVWIPTWWNFEAATPACPKCPAFLRK